MLVQKYKDMLSGKSVIRQLSEFATARGQEIGYENVFDYSLGNPSVPVPREFTDRMIHMLATKEPLELHGYSPSLGITSVREAIAENLEKRFGLPYRKEHIFMASGAAGALAHAFRLVTEPGDEILTFAPFFPEYHPYVDLTGAVLKVVPPNLENFQINFEAFEEMLTEKVKAVLINTPNNPSGVVYSTPTLQRLADILREKSREYGHIIYLISDEPYREIVFEGVDSPCVSYFYDNTIMCYSFSKSLSLPGERIGYVAVNPACEDAETMINMCGQISRGIGHNCPPSIIQLAVADVNGDGVVDQADADWIHENEAVELGACDISVPNPTSLFYQLVYIANTGAGNHFTIVDEDISTEQIFDLKISQKNFNLLDVTGDGKIDLDDINGLGAYIGHKGAGFDLSRYFAIGRYDYDITEFAKIYGTPKDAVLVKDDLSDLVK